MNCLDSGLKCWMVFLALVGKQLDWLLIVLSSSLALSFSLLLVQGPFFFLLLPSDFLFCFRTSNGIKLSKVFIWVSERINYWNNVTDGSVLL